MRWDAGFTMMSSLNPTYGMGRDKGNLPLPRPGYLKIVLILRTRWTGNPSGWIPYLGSVMARSLRVSVVAGLARSTASKVQSCLVSCSFLLFVFDIFVRIAESNHLRARRNNRSP
jgi:hypothetical protein